MSKFVRFIINNKIDRQDIVCGLTEAGYIVTVLNISKDGNDVDRCIYVEVADRDILVALVNQE